MKASDIPSKFQIPFASAAGGSYIRAIPQASQIGITAGAASLTDGFPPVNFVPVGSGGTPPAGEDFNGILNQITLWTRWQNAGAFVVYDGTFSTAIGGYPKGAVLASTSAGSLWLNTTDDNTTNPDSAGSGWVQVRSANSGFAVDTGSANAYVVTLAPAPIALVDGMVQRVKITHTNTGASNLNIGLGNNAIVAGGAPLAGGELVASGYYEFTYGAAISSWQITGQSAGQVIVPTAVLSGAAVNLAQLASYPGLHIQSFASSGTYTPTSGYTRALIIATGGGEGGAYGGAGRAGATAFATVSLIGLGAQTVSIGAGGAGTSGGGGTGGAGGTTSIGAIASASGGAATYAITGAFGVRGGTTALFTRFNGAPSFWGPGGPDALPGGDGVAPGSGGGEAGSSGSGGAGAAGFVMVLEFK